MGVTLPVRMVADVPEATRPGRLRPTRRARVLLGSAIVVGALVLVGPTVLDALQGEAECEVVTTDGAVGLSRDEARRATTSVALARRDLAAPDTSDIDPAVMTRLADGPPDDAGP